MDTLINSEFGDTKESVQKDVMGFERGIRVFGVIPLHVSVQVRTVGSIGRPGAKERKMISQINITKNQAQELISALQEAIKDI